MQGREIRDKIRIEFGPVITMEYSAAACAKILEPMQEIDCAQHSESGLMSKGSCACYLYVLFTNSDFLQIHFCSKTVGSLSIKYHSSALGCVLNLCIKIAFCNFQSDSCDIVIA